MSVPVPGLRSNGAGVAPGWLVGRPIAHRGLHDGARGIIENSASAATAAIAGGFGIECDVQLTADGEAAVFHDFALDRLTARSGPTVAMSAGELAQTPLRGSDDRILTLPAFLDLIDGRVPLVCEVKSRFDGDLRLAERVVAIVANYAGPLAIKSFDPVVVRHLRRLALPCPIGIVAEASYEDPEWAGLSADLRRELAEMLHFAETRPDFLSYRVADLPHAVPYLCRRAIGLPVMTWTVRTEEQRRRAAVWADQMVFEGFVP